MLKNISHKLGRQISSSVRQFGRINEQLSSGKRVNRAADDAAGLAVASRSRTKAISVARANHNIGEAMSAVQLAEAGASVIFESLTEMMKLAVQSSNGIYSDADRDLLQQEYEGHQSAIQAISLGANHQNNLTVLNAGWVQLAFAIDVSGSMGGEIANLRDAINGGSSSLASLLENNDIYTQFSLTAVGHREDFADSADTKAELGDPDFTDELNILSARGQAEDPYAAITSMLGGIGNDAVGFAPLADQRHIVYITDTGREYIADATVDQSTTQTALLDNGITFHAIRSGGGGGALDGFVSATGGTKYGLSSDGSNIAAALDEINDVILDAADSKRPTAMQVGAEVAEQLDVDVPVNLSLNALNLNFTSSNIKTREAADTAIGQIRSAIQYFGTRRTMLGASFNRLQVALESNLNRHVELQAHAARIEDADIAKTVAVSIGMQFRARTSTEMLQKWFQIQSNTLSELFGPGEALSA